MLEFKLVQGNLLKKVVSPLVHIATRATVIATPESISLQTSSPNLMVIAVARINSYRFDRFYTGQSCSVGIELNALDAILSTTDDDESITVRSLFLENLVSFTFRIGIHQTRTEEAYVVQIPNNHVNIDESEYNYDVAVGIPSEEFRHILLYFRSFRGGAVFVSVTDSQVRFRSVGREIILIKENGDCIIGGVEESDGECRLRLNLYTMNSIFEASQHSPTAWLFGSQDAPDMLNCPVEQLGNIFYYFV
ncbi:unnamed protein product [Camellia sinensis]